MYNVTLRCVDVTIFAVSITYYESGCVCNLNYPEYKTQSCNMMSSVARPALPYFSTLSPKQHDYRGGGY
jgi:hypothetical protein